MFWMSWYVVVVVVAVVIAVLVAFVVVVVVTCPMFIAHNLVLPLRLALPSNSQL